MAKQVKIKDIAKMAGVSAGTVDRIIHNRGNVSEASRKAVEGVLAEVGYKYNIHASAISFRKEYNIVISTPTASPGEYWGSVQEGIEHAFEEYSDISINYKYAPYDQFDVYSCRSVFNSILDFSPDAVIIGPTFTEETVSLCEELNIHGVPYVFIDSVVEGTSPIATFTTDMQASGMLLGKMLHMMIPENGEIAIFGVRRIGNQRSNNSLARRKGLIEYLEKAGIGYKLKETSFSAINPDENDESIIRFLKENPNVKGIAVMNSRGYIIADILKKNGMDNIKLISFDLTTNNVRCIDEGSTSALLCQRPKTQGFNAVRSIIHFLLYNCKEKVTNHIMPIDIILKENLPFYKELYTE